MQGRRASIKFIEACYRLYEQKMYQAAYRILWDSGLAEDAVQDAAYIHGVPGLDGMGADIDMEELVSRLPAKYYAAVHCLAVKELSMKETAAELGITEAAVPFLIICIPMMSNAAAHGSFFGRIWGNLTKENIASHDEKMHNEQELPFTHTFPAREYVPAGQETARELIGRHVSCQLIEKELGRGGNQQPDGLSSGTGGDARIMLS